jgi:predicted dehydrogenase
MELAGARGHIVADHVRSEAWLTRGSERTPIPIVAPIPTVREALRAFVAALRDGTPMPITVDDGLRAVAIADACYRSAAQGGVPQTVGA